MASPFEKKGIEGDLTERFELFLRSGAKTIARAFPAACCGVSEHNNN
jgi:hypothetical protein